MRIVESELATVDRARAYQLGDVLVLQVAGTRPTACHLVSLERALADVEPPSFVARMSIDPLAKCAAVVADFEVAQAFRTGGYREAVVVHHAGGEFSVEVTALDAGERLGVVQEGRPPIELPQTEPSEAVGYSSSWDLQEAMRDAIAQLPRRDDISDWLYHYEVVEVGAEIGGIAGFNRMRVTVRG
ncbi:hypothetical protein [Georgenia sp. Marseille-Q6866]